MRPHRWVDIAIVFQGAMNALNPVRTIGDQIVESLELHDRGQGAAARARTGELLESVGIPAGRGERAIRTSCRAGCASGRRSRWHSSCNPGVLIADEPTTALDVMVQAQILELLDALCRDFGLALVLVTHDLPVVAQLCNRCAVMYAGEIVERGPLDVLYHAPGHPYTRMLFAASPDLGTGDAPCSRSRARRRGSTGRSTGVRSGHAATPPSPPASMRPRLRRSSATTTPPPATSTPGAGVTRAEPTRAGGRGSRRPLPDPPRSRRRRSRASRAGKSMRSRRLALAAARARCSRSSASRAAARRRRRRRCCGSSTRSRARSASTAATSCRSVARRCVRCGAGSRSSTRIRTSLSTRGSACEPWSRSRS